MSSLRLDPEASTVLEVRITDFEHFRAATSARDTGRDQAFTIRLTAEVSLNNKATNKAYFSNRTVYADVNVYDSSEGILGTEYQNMPALTRILAQKINDEVIGIW